MRCLDALDLGVCTSLLLGVRGFAWWRWKHRGNLEPDRERELYDEVAGKPAPKVFDGRRGQRDELQESWSIYEHPDRKPIRREQMEAVNGR